LPCSPAAGAVAERQAIGDEPGSGHSRDLIHLAPGDITVGKLAHDRMAVDLHPIDRALRVAIPQAGAHHRDILRPLLDQTFERRNRVGKEDHVLVDLNVKSRRAAIEHLLERSRHRRDVIDDLDGALDALRLQVVHAIAEILRVAYRRNEDGGARCARVDHASGTASDIMLK
jgi:hypothetical protein